MESQRNLLFLALLFVSFLLYQAWVTEQNPQPVAAAQTTEQSTSQSSVPSTSNHSADIPASSEDHSSVAAQVPTQAPTNAITVLENDQLRLEITLVGGDVVVADLIEHDDELDSGVPFRLLENANGFTYIAQSGLIGKQGPDANPKGRPYYSTNSKENVLADGEDSVSTALRYVDQAGNVFTKTFTLKRGEYNVTVDYTIENKSASDVNVQLYGQLKESLKEHSTNLMMPVYRGGAFSTDDTKYSKYTFDDMVERNLSETTQGGWVAMLQHYFVSAWVPNANDNNVLYTNVIQNKDAAIGFKSPIKTIAPNSTEKFSTNLWIGPKLQDEMSQVGESLDLTVDYGWLWWLAQPLFKLLLFFQGIVGNWGVAIILITFTVKGLLYPLTKAQYTSMAKMRLLQPKIQALRERYGEDRQKVSKAMMEMYKEEKVNPLGGCFPILLQMPIFIALYWSLMEAVELRHAPFMFWIQDLSVQDPYYILPILMGVSMFFIQKMSPATVQDPMQQKIMKFMPVVFTFFFLWFPAGLVLYWLMSNIVTLVQQTVIYRQFEKNGLSAKK
ncbi:membrane protein insertase YidC [Psychromonas sp. 14N.309.X.WAT.B.A12]|uniref:membrane protein insertase YidC n=1 Tax=unclassified Psychromonas TaxID=2614957 RepID=UPI0025B2378B|nr:membrane protein insertase YidC [Psychromonas sp. 14N.309.X.WAT.B.A12]MDN2664754.1 membrane protein insertase YidC [Psychromonas sp. 14N.309.X.WAT.B.A12]